MRCRAHHQGQRTNIPNVLLAGNNRRSWTTTWSIAVLLININQKQASEEWTNSSRNPLKDHWWNNNLSGFSLFHFLPLHEKLHVAQYVILLCLFFQTNLILQMTISWNNLCLSVHMQSLIPGIVQSVTGHSKPHATICIMCLTENYVKDVLYMFAFFFFYLIWPLWIIVEVWLVIV